MCTVRAVSLVALLACALAGPNTQLCLHCDHLTDPSHCTVYQACHLHDHSCSTEVYVNNNQYVYKLGCTADHDCQNFVYTVVGKRAPGHHGHVHGQVVCQQCCATTGCNKDLCGGYGTTTTTTATTTVTKHVPSATTSSLCRDIEDENFKCTDYDKYHLCDTDTGLGYELGHKRCQKHCGFCNTNGTLSTYILRDLHADFVTKLDNPSTYAATSTTDLPVTANTSGPLTSLLSSNPVPQNTTAWVPVGATVNVNQVATTTAVCRDFEDANFSCVEWSSHGFCQMSTGQGHEIAKLRCAKYCGFC